ncbi:TPA: hypothetical protein ACGO8M_002256 [Streptococcus suis]
MTEKQIKAIQAFAKKSLCNLKHRPALNQVKVINGNAYFTDSHMAIYFKDYFSDDVPLNGFTAEQLADLSYPDVERLLNPNGYPTKYNFTISEILETLKNGKKLGNWKDRKTNKQYYHIENGEILPESSIHFCTFNPVMLFHSLNCLKKFGEKEIEISLNPERTYYPFRIIGKVTNIEMLLTPIRTH